MRERPDAYSGNGYEIFENAIPAAKLDVIRSDIAQIFVRRAQSLAIETPTGSGHSDITAQATALFEKDPAAYVAAAKICQHLPSVHQLGVGPEVSSILQSVGIDTPLISTRPVIHFMADHLKIEGGYHKTPAHQDWRSVQGSVDGVTLWIPLFDVGENDYPLEVIPGSHLGGLRPSENDAFGHRVSAEEVRDSDFRAVPMARGDVLIFSGFLIHRTGARGDTLVRIALSYRFNNGAEPSFVARDYPDRYIYRAQKELLDPQFPSNADVRRIFGR